VMWLTEASSPRASVSAKTSPGSMERKVLTAQSTVNGSAPRPTSRDYLARAMFFHHKFDHVYEGSPPPRVCFMVCAMPRSGSSLLCDVLAATEMAGAPTEFFAPNQMDE